MKGRQIKLQHIKVSKLPYDTKNAFVESRLVKETLTLNFQSVFIYITDCSKAILLLWFYLFHVLELNVCAVLYLMDASIF